MIDEKKELMTYSFADPGLEVCVRSSEDDETTAIVKNTGTQRIYAIELVFNWYFENGEDKFLVANTKNSIECLWPDMTWLCVVPDQGEYIPELACVLYKPGTHDEKYYSQPVPPDQPLHVYSMPSASDEEYFQGVFSRETKNNCRSAAEINIDISAASGAISYHQQLTQKTPANQLVDCERSF